ncbi:ribonuclease H-like domain-containing protein, partial [Tanacetum coccineum]
GNPQLELQEKGFIDNGCSRHMTKNKSYLSDYEEINGGFVTFGGNSKGGKLTGKSVLQMCDKKTSVLFTDTECVVLSSDFKLTNENHVLLKVPRKDNMYSVDLRNVNKEMNQFCEMKGIKREFSVARTPQQNEVAKRKNRTLIKTARTMLADSKLPTTFWAEAINTACYVQNRVLVIKPHNMTPYERFLGRKPALSFMRLFGCPVTLLNTIDHLGKFDRKANEGFFVGYCTNSKAFRVFNSRTRIVKENLHVKFSEESPNIAGYRLNWLFDIDALTKSMNYEPVISNHHGEGKEGCEDPEDEDPNLEEIVYSDDDEDVGAEADMTNLDTHIPVSPIPTTRIHKDQNPPSFEQIMEYTFIHLKREGCKDKAFDYHGMLVFSAIENQPQRFFQNCLFGLFFITSKNQEVIQALIDPSLIEAMQDELLQFKLQKVWTLVDLLYGKRAIGTKWVYRNKKDERVARIEAIKLFLAYASFKDFIVYQMDVKVPFRWNWN